MDGTTFISEIKNEPYKDPQDNVFSTRWAEYEEVVMYSLVTSFVNDFATKTNVTQDSVRKIKDTLIIC